MGGLSFESLNDDLACLVLEKLFPLNSVLFAFEGVADLANFARVSRRYARVVRESGWAAACRRVAPKLCADLVPIGGPENSPGGTGWMSFAKLLAWCPGRLETPEKIRSGPFDCQGIKSLGTMHECEPAKQHVCRYNLSVVEEVSAGSIILTAEAEGSAEASFMLCCVHEVKHRDGFGIVGEIRCQVARKVFRGFVGSARVFATLIGNEPEKACEKLGICPFCPSSVRRVPRKALRVTETTAADFRMCGTGHVVGIVEYRVGAFRQLWEGEISISRGDDERWRWPEGTRSVGPDVTSDLSDPD